MFILSGTPKLLNDISTDTIGNGVYADGGDKTLCCWFGVGGSFGGGSIIFEASADNGNSWIVLTYNGQPAVFTEPKVLHLNRLGQGMLIRATLSGSSGASHVFADMFQ